MRTLFRWVIVLPFALLLVLFAVANRHVVTVSIDPFPGDAIQGPVFEAPLFVVMALCGVLGVVAGGLAMWAGQGRYRRAARNAHAAAQEARAEADRLRAAAPEPETPALPGLQLHRGLTLDAKKQLRRDVA
jgi:uncharacterized integral membrane protein